MCAAVPVLRRQAVRGEVDQAKFTLPAGTGFGVLGVLFSLVLVTRMTGREAVIVAIVVAAATVNWWMVRLKAR